MTVAVLVPVLHRPHRVVPLLESLETATPEPHRTLFICSPDDHAEHAAVDAAGAERLTADWLPGRGDYARKINVGYRLTTDPYLFLAADDLHFHAGWLTAALDHVTARHQVVGTQDLANQRVIDGRHSTHSLVTRNYVDTYGTVDQPGEVLHEGYPHEYVDDEFIETARRRRAFVFAPDSIVEHLHPMVGKAPMDPLYAAQADRMTIGRRIYQRRRRLWMSRSA